MYTIVRRPLVPLSRQRPKAVMAVITGEVICPNASPKLDQFLLAQHTSGRLCSRHDTGACGATCSLPSDRRYFASSRVAPPDADVSGFPDGSMAQKLLDQCLEAAVVRGVDVNAPYEPWLPVDLMQTLMVDVHEAVGCSWFAAIILAVVGIRIVTLPVSIAAIRGSRQKALIQPQFNELMEKQKALSMEGDQEKLADVSKKLQAFQQKHGKFFMLKGTWNLICFQMPLYITAFASMRGFAGHPDLFRGFAMESPLWLDSLALPDPYAILPLFTAAIMLTNTELFGSIDTEVAASVPTDAQKDSNVGGLGGQSTFQKYQKWIMRGSSMMFVPLTWNFPAGVFVFMSTNLIVATTQNRILRLPVLERLLEIPPTLESVTAANKAATSSGPGPLLPLQRTLQHYGVGNIAVAGSKVTVDSLQIATSVLDAAPKQLQIPTRSQPEMQTSKERSLEDVKVDPRFAVSRARPLRPGYA